ncbi:hypothetical protein C8F04DRAFT_1189300 [Mycena alexandri]|uniref:Uncharacterized protein n=1 Tax=Mycena alexandri TaxID=1745969 RepID=A0AAD6WUG5_9AGAR|nr:hypothetical protein C8F04DRAFT_1189300 [Mycena alexandri]
MSTQTSNNTTSPATTSTSARRQPAPFRFNGAREAFLRLRLDDFFSAVATGELRQFWSALFTDYWFHFPWRLPITEDPHCAMLLDRPGDHLSHEDIDKKTATLLITQQASHPVPMRIRAWFFHKHWWKDYHRQRAAREVRPIIVDQPTGDQGRIYTFIPTRAAPLVGTIQNDGRLLMKYDASGPSITPVRPITHARLPGLQSRAAQDAEVRRRTAPSSDEQLLARLKMSPVERRRLELQAQLRSAFGPLSREQHRRKLKLAIGQKQNQEKENVPPSARQ